MVRQRCQSFSTRCLLKIAQYIPSTHGDGWKLFFVQWQRRLISFLQSVLSLLHPEISFSPLTYWTGLTVGAILKGAEIYHVKNWFFFHETLAPHPFLVAFILITSFLRVKMKNGANSVDRKGRREWAFMFQSFYKSLGMGNGAFLSFQSNWTWVGASFTYVLPRRSEWNNKQSP